MASTKPNMTSREFDSGASMTTPLKASALRVGDLVLIRERPCRVLELSQHKTGKHGKGKLSITALDLRTGKKALDMCPSTAMLEVPVVEKRELLVMYIGEGEAPFLSLLDLGTKTTDASVRLPNFELGRGLRKAVEEAGSGEIMISMSRAYGVDEVKSFKRMSRSDD